MEMEINFFAEKRYMYFLQGQKEEHVEICFKCELSPHFSYQGLTRTEGDHLMNDRILLTN